MAKVAPKQKKLDTSNFVPSIFIIGFMCVGFIPNWEAVDKIAPQWLYLSILNLCTGIYLFLNRKNYSDRITSVLSSWMSIFYISCCMGSNCLISMQLIQLKFWLILSVILTHYLCF